MGLAVTLGVRPSGKKYEVPEVGSEDLGSLVRIAMSPSYLENDQDRKYTYKECWE